jgi:hypothetical protein
MVRVVAMAAKKASIPLPEVFVSGRVSSAAIRRAVERGELRKIAPRLYTPNLVDTPEAIIRRNLWQVISLLFPGTVVSHRTALTQKPTPGGTVFLTGGYERTVRLPGATIRILKGPGPLPGDTSYFGALHMASEARCLLECLSLSRIRGSESSAIPRAEVETILERRLSHRGDGWINAVRDRAREIAPALDMNGAFASLDAMVGALLGTRRGRLHAPSAIARSAGVPYDAHRLERFTVLADALRAWPSTDRPDIGVGSREFQNLAFFDAYFSNFIEGTEFGVEEALGIVFQNRIPAARPADAHDVIGTFRLLASGHEMGRSAVDLARDWPAFRALLASRHETILRGRPETAPGRFKEEVNRAGDTMFVHPDLLAGTLAKGMEILPSLPDPFHRAVYMMFLIAEVHPFNDGNGRLARAMMNAELISGGQRRILIPTAFRIDYIGGLRRLSRNDDPHPLIQVLDFAQRFTAAIDFTDVTSAQAVLQRCGAFDSGDEARLRMPRPA